MITSTVAILFAVGYLLATVWLCRGIRLTARDLCLGGIVCAMTLVLATIRIPLPTGSNITCGSWIPLMLLALLYDYRLSMLSGWVCGILAMLLIPGWQAVHWAQIFVQQLVCFSCLGYAGVFGSDKRWKAICGMALAVAIRCFGHVISGVIFYSQNAWDGWGATIADEIAVIKEAQEHLKIVNLGATAIGTTVTAHPEYPALAVKHLAEITGIDFKNSDDLIAATSDCGAYVALSSAVKSLAVKLTKVCNDLRLLASGPRTGLSELILPQLQPGSSIMPGKVNPVIPEVTNQACFLAIGLDTTVMLAASAGQLELNVMEPVITFALYMQMKVLTNACNHLREKCIDGIVVNAEHCKDLVMGSLGIVTLLKPHFGYKPCANIAREGFLTGKSLHQLVVEEKGMLTQEQWDHTFTYENLINPKFEK